MKTNDSLSIADYPSYMDAVRFSRIEPLLEGSSKKTKPLEVSLHEIFNAVLYVLREGVRWRALPHDFPKWSTVYYHFAKWRDHIDPASKLSLLALVLKELTRADREADGRDGETTMIIIDAQSVKNTDPAELKGYDGGKKVSGIKRHLAVDSRGLPHMIWVTTANISDKAGAREMIAQRAGEFGKVKKYSWTAATTARPLRSSSGTSWMRRSKSPSATSCTPSR